MLNLCFLVPDDAAVLQPSGIIIASSSGGAVDTCIFNGRLKNESDVTVAMSGCPFNDTFEVSFKLSTKINFMKSS